MDLAEDAILLTRQVPFEPHKTVPPESLIDQPCPFGCTSIDGFPGKMVIRYHSLEWAHIRCSNLNCIYRPFSVKSPLDLSTRFPQDENQQNSIDMFLTWMEEEKALVNAEDFADAVTADSQKYKAFEIDQEQSTTEIAAQEPKTFSAPTPLLDLDEFSLVSSQQNYFLQKSYTYNLHEKSSSVSSQSQIDDDYEETPKKRRGRRRKSEGDAPAPVKPPSGKKRGRPKGYSPKKARMEAELRASQSPATPQRWEIVDLNDKAAVNDRVQYHAFKPIKKEKKLFSLKTAARNLFGDGPKKYNKARLHFIKALILAGRTSDQKSGIRPKETSHEINMKGKSSKTPDVTVTPKRKRTDGKLTAIKAPCGRMDLSEKGLSPALKQPASTKNTGKDQCSKKPRTFSTRVTNNKPAIVNPSGRILRPRHKTL